MERFETLSVSIREDMMPRTTVYIISDDTEAIEKAKTYFAPMGFNVTAYYPGQWREGLDQAHFRSQLSQGTTPLVTGQNPLERSNVLPFPNGSTGNGAETKVAKMDELESKAIENAIVQYRGNLTEAAKALGIGRATLYRKVKLYQIDPSQARKKRVA
jgi:hypothetical protein